MGDYTKNTKVVFYDSGEIEIGEVDDLGNLRTSFLYFRNFSEFIDLLKTNPKLLDGVLDNFLDLAKVRDIERLRKEEASRVSDVQELIKVINIDYVVKQLLAHFTELDANVNRKNYPTAFISSGLIINQLKEIITKFNDLYLNLLVLEKLGKIL